MNTTEIIKELSKNPNIGLKKEDCRIVYDILIEIMKNGLKRDGKLQLNETATLHITDIAGREGKNPLNSEQDIIIQPRKQIFFRASKALKEFINN